MRSVRVMLVALGLAMVALGCSSDSKTPTSSASTASGSVAPENVRASAAAVASGLKAIQATAEAMVAAGTDKTKLASEDANIEPAWAKIEGTVKANDPDTYLTFEDNFAQLKKGAEEGDASKVKTASNAVAAAVAAYLARYPG